MSVRDRTVDRFAGRIGPQALSRWVDQALPWLQAESVHAGTATGAQKAWAARGTIKAEPHPGMRARIQYFSMCMAAHHLTVASYHPTDVDAYIRGVAWNEADERVLAAHDAALRQARSWSIAGLNPRRVDIGSQPISGHDGEYLGSAAGCVGGWLRRGQTAPAAAMAELIDSELAREAAAFTALSAQPGRERELLILAALITHNVGDLDQGLRYWPAGLGGGSGAAYVARWHDLAHADDRCGGIFARAQRIYGATLATEGHRNYPLRHVKTLRRSAELWLPMGPFLDDWGRTIATTPHLGESERVEVLIALLHGVATIPRQQGYQRAIAGIARAEVLPRLSKGLSATQLSGLTHPLVVAALKTTQADYEQHWADTALRLLRS